MPDLIVSEIRNCLLDITHEVALVLQHSRIVTLGRPFEHCYIPVVLGPWAFAQGLRMYGYLVEAI